MAQTAKHPPTMRETWVLSLGWEDPPEKEMATHSSTLAEKIPWMEEPGGLQSTGSQSRTWLRDFTTSSNAKLLSKVVEPIFILTSSAWEFLSHHIPFCPQFYLFKINSGDLLGVQWLRFHASFAMGMGLIPDLESFTCPALWPKKIQ